MKTQPGMKRPTIERCLEDCAREAGELLLKFFGKITNVRRKDNPSSVVCDADVAAEKAILKRLKAGFPQDGIIAEESGLTRGSSEYTWVVDPLDGTSNFVAGLPWFGAQLGVLRNGRPLAAAMFLPIEGKLYLAEAGAGVVCNGSKIRVTDESDLKNTLCAFGFDPGAGEQTSRANMDLLRRISHGVRNIRATNSLVDFCYTLEGRFGGCINLNTKIWDIVPISVMLPEAGGVFTNLDGEATAFDLGARTFGRSYRVLGASRALHPKLLRLVRSDH